MRISITLVLALYLAGVPAGSTLGGDEALPVHGALPVSIVDLRSDHQLQQDLARYAKAVFLHQLSLGPAVSPPPWTAEIQQASFVTFFVGKKVIACSGNFRPRTANLGSEIDANVRQALHIDPRARFIDRAAAVAARVVITFPGEPYPVSSHEMIDPAKLGLFVENDHFGVAIVPGEAKTASWAYREALRRLGEKDPTSVRLFAFDSWRISSERH